MKKTVKFIAICSFLAIIVHKGSFAQDVDELKEREVRKIDRFFDDNTLWKRFPDTSRIYAFAFKVIVQKISKRNFKVISISTNDSLAYWLYPDYKFLQTINYGLFMNHRKRATFVFPVILDVWNQKWPESPAPRYDDVVSGAFSLIPEGVSRIENWTYFRPYMLRLDLSIRH